MMSGEAATGRRICSVAVLTATLVLAGCATSNGNSNPSGTGSRQCHEPARYTFVLDSRCGEQPLIGRFQISVANGTVTVATGLDDAARNALAGGRRDLVPTLGRLVDELETAKHTGADVAQADVDPGCCCRRMLVAKAPTADGALSAACRRPGAGGARPPRRSAAKASTRCPCGAVTRGR